MLPLLGEMLAQARVGTRCVHVGVRGHHAACHHVARFLVGTDSGAWGRKPLLLVAFGALPVRGVLYTLTHNTGALVAIQILDGVGAGIFGVVSVLVIADLTRGSGRFNLASGPSARRSALAPRLARPLPVPSCTTLVPTRAFFLAAVASVAFGILYFFMPETRDNDSPSNPGAPTL